MGDMGFKTSPCACGAVVSAGSTTGAIFDGNGTPYFLRKQVLVESVITHGGAVRLSQGPGFYLMVW